SMAIAAHGSKRDRVVILSWFRGRHVTKEQRPREPHFLRISCCSGVARTLFIELADRGPLNFGVFVEAFVFLERNSVIVRREVRVSEGEYAGLGSTDEAENSVLTFVDSVFLGISDGGPGKQHT